jgi:heme/copper-type cytochrome/quinol oxidase subunit 3
VSELAQHSTAYEVVENEPPDVLARNLRVASQLWASATLFFFFAFLFAYFYLRSLNQQHLWKPKGVDISGGWGIAVAACIVASAALLWSGRIDQRADRRSTWRLKGLGALVLGLLSIVLQIVAWTQAGFGPTDGGYASVYFGWTALYMFFILATLYWLETCLAVSYRYRSHAMDAPQVEPGHASGDPYREGQDIENPVTLNIAELAALSFYWAVLAGIGVVTWFVLYVI